MSCVNNHACSAPSQQTLYSTVSGRYPPPLTLRSTVIDRRALCPLRMRATLLVVIQRQVLPAGGAAFEAVGRSVVCWHMVRARQGVKVVRAGLSGPGRTP